MTNLINKILSNCENLTSVTSDELLLVTDEFHKQLALGRAIDDNLYRACDVAKAELQNRGINV